MCILLGCLPALAATMSYSTDFSSDPEWTTDQPTNFYWDQISQTYHIRSEHQYPGYTPSRYSYELLPESVGSFELQWDVKPTQIDWSSGIPFGLYDSQLTTGGIQGGQYIQAMPVYVDQGFLWAVYASGPDDGASASSGSGAWSIDQWYTCKLTYDTGTNTVSFEAKNRDTAATIWSTNLTIAGGSFTGLEYLGSSRTGIGEGGGPPEWPVAEGFIDNVSLVPEPATLLLFGLGGFALRRKRRR